MKTLPTECALSTAPVEMAEAIIASINTGGPGNTGGADSRSMVLSFDWRGLRHMRRHHPEATTGWLTQQMDDDERRLWWGEEFAARYGCSAARLIAEQDGHYKMAITGYRSSEDCGSQKSPRRGGSDCRSLPGTSIASKTSNGLWTGRIDGLITDRPDLALELRAARRRSATPSVA